MAFSSSVVFKNNAAANITFVETKRAGQRVERLHSGTTLQLPTRLIFDHSVVNGANGLMDRHLLQVTSTETAGDGTATTVVNLTISIPRNAPNLTKAKDAIAYLCDMLLTTGVANASFDAIARGES